jgi:hypothetical protein
MMQHNVKNALLIEKWNIPLVCLGVKTYLSLDRKYRFNKAMKWVE